MKNINEIINEVKSLRGANVKVFGQPTTLSSELDETTIDVIDVLENFKGKEKSLEVDTFDQEGDYDETIELDTIDEYFQYLENTFGYEIKEISCNNTYNWSSPISNDIDYKIYEVEGEILVEMMVHRYGDVRGNYTDSILLSYCDDYEFLEDLCVHKSLEIEIDDRTFDVDINVGSDTYEIYENGTYIDSAYGDYDDVVEKCKELVA